MTTREELIQAKMAEIRLVEKEAIIAAEIEAEAIIHIETEKLNLAIENNDIKTLQKLAGQNNIQLPIICEPQYSIWDRFIDGAGSPCILVRDKARQILVNESNKEHTRILVKYATEFYNKDSDTFTPRHIECVWHVQKEVRQKVFDKILDGSITRYDEVSRWISIEHKKWMRQNEENISLALEKKQINKRTNESITDCKQSIIDTKQRIEELKNRQTTSPTPEMYNKELEKITSRLVSHTSQLQKLESTLLDYV
jgi:hypothetical protein